eukprot:8197762-Prorocentrum_lima.AAC.1
MPSTYSCAEGPEHADEIDRLPATEQALESHESLPRTSGHGGTEKPSALAKLPIATAAAAQDAQTRLAPAPIRDSSDAQEVSETPRRSRIPKPTARPERRCPVLEPAPSSAPNAAAPPASPEVSASRPPPASPQEDSAFVLAPETGLANVGTTEVDVRSRQKILSVAEHKDDDAAGFVADE